jgi:hypothetical protein
MVGAAFALSSLLCDGGEEFECGFAGAGLGGALAPNACASGAALVVAVQYGRHDTVGRSLRSVRAAAVCLVQAVTGKVVRVAGEAHKRRDETKSAAGRRTMPLSLFAVAMLNRTPRARDRL